MGFLWLLVKGVVNCGWAGGCVYVCVWIKGGGISDDGGYAVGFAGVGYGLV